MKKTTNFKIGNSVVVKDGVMCPDMESLSIAGWQGRIIEILDEEDDEVLIDIKLDSITLKSLPKYYIEQSEDEGLCWFRMILGVSDVNLTTPRDKEKDTQKVIDELSELYYWSFLGEEGVRINEILKGIDSDDEDACMEAWEKHLKDVLFFPFDAKVTDDGELPLRSGNRVQVNSLAAISDFYGVTVNVTFNGKKYVYPLCDLEVANEKSPNYQSVEDYAVWFANM
jgi:hypothetical protein